MDKVFEEKYHRLEGIHWWSVGRRDMILKLLSGAGKELKILDAGCAGGALLKFLAKNGYRNISGIDVSSDAVAFCRKNGIENVSMADAAKTGFKDGEFDVVIASDVLEHIKDEATALAEWRRILKNGGKLLVFTPAFRFLWSGHDEVNRHFRRYSAPELERALKNAGFHIKRISYWNFCLFFPVAIIRLLSHFSNNSKNKEGQFYELNKFMNKLLVALLKAENFVLTKINFPFGISVFAIAEK